MEFPKCDFGAVEHQPVPGRDRSVRIADVVIGDSHVMMGKTQEGFAAFSCMLRVYLADAAAYGRALSAGAASVQEPTSIYCGDHSVGVLDWSGNTWWPASRQENITAAELAQRLGAGGQQFPVVRSAS